MISIDKQELLFNDYKEIVSQDKEGGVILRTCSGGLELFQERESCPGTNEWYLSTEQGTELEFVSSMPAIP